MAELKSVSMTSGEGKNKRETTVEVRKISNGFILRENTNWRDSKDNYKYETKETYYEENPIKGIKLPTS